MTQLPSIATSEIFGKFVSHFWETHTKPWGFGIGQSFSDKDGSIIAVKWLKVNVGENFGSAAALLDFLEKRGNTLGERNYQISSEEAGSIIGDYFQWCLNDGKFHENIAALGCNTEEISLIFYYDEAELQEAVSSLEDAHFRLALMTRLYKEPNSMNLDEMFDVLPNLMWTNEDPFTPDEWNRLWISGETSGITLLEQDKIPSYHWANPAIEGIRIANPLMVRHGAHLAPGTTVMNYGFVNFNAGTLGKAMVEGRISAGTVIGAGSDIGAGAGFLGTLSGGNSIRMSMGENCLLGAMAECGIPLGDNVLIKEGVVFSAGTLVAVVTWETDEDGKFITGKDGKPIEIERKIVKAIELKGISDVTFRQNSQTGAIEVLPIPNKVKLNDMLHAND